MHVAIVGLGLMGGSLALALKQNGWCTRLTGVSRNSETLRAARDAGAIDSGTTDLAAGVGDADIIVLATPVRTILLQLPRVGRYAKPDAIVLDLGSTKQEVCAEMARLPDGLQPVGGHPMCGKEVGGFAAADARLYCGRTFVLCPLQRTAERSLEVVRSLAEAAGSKVRILDPEAHDHAVAAISHLPYVVAAALVNSVTAKDDDLARTLAASGFRDTTRIAASAVDMMIDVLLTNREAVLDWLASFDGQLSAIGAALAQDDEVELRKRLAQAQLGRSSMKF